MADGGITALGANVLNMAIVAVFVGIRGLPSAQTSAAAHFDRVPGLARRSPPGCRSWRPPRPARSNWPSPAPCHCATPCRAMVSVHMVIGLGEALITVAIASAVLVARPDLVRTYDLPAGEAFRRDRLVDPPPDFASGRSSPAPSWWRRRSPSSSRPSPPRLPDGLESVAVAQGAEGAATATPAGSSRLSPDYQLPGVESQAVSTALAGLIGTAALFAVVILAGRALGRRRPKAESG